MRRHGYLLEIAGTVWRRSGSPPLGSAVLRQRRSRYLGLLAQKGLLYVTRPDALNTYAASARKYVAMAKEIFEVVQYGLRSDTRSTRPSVKGAAKAHAISPRSKTKGSTVLRGETAATAAVSRGSRGPALRCADACFHLARQSDGSEGSKDKHDADYREGVADNPWTRAWCLDRLAGAMMAAGGAAAGSGNAVTGRRRSFASGCGILRPR